LLCVANIITYLTLTTTTHTHTCERDSGQVVACCYVSLATCSQLARLTDTNSLIIYTIIIVTHSSVANSGDSRVVWSCNGLYSVAQTLTTWSSTIAASSPLETAFLFQRLSITVQRFNAVLTSDPRNLWFLRDSIYAIASIWYRPSVCLSVRRVYHRKTV